MLHHVMREDAQLLFGQLMILYAVVMVDAGLRAPADVESAEHMLFCPVEDLAKLGPKAHFLEALRLDGGAGDDHAVVVLVADLVERDVEIAHVLHLVIEGIAIGAQKLDVHLQRRVGEFAQDERLGFDFGGHQV